MNKFTKWLAAGLAAVTMATAGWYVNAWTGIVESSESVAMATIRKNRIVENTGEKSAAGCKNLSLNEQPQANIEDKNATICKNLSVSEKSSQNYTAFTASDKIPLEPWLQFKLHQIAEENGVPYPLAVAVIEVESTFRADAYNDGCYGLMQVSTVHAPREVLLDPVDNMRLGCWLLGALHRKYKDWNKALVAYNCGEAGAYRYYFSRGAISSEYSRKVLLASERWARELGEKSVLMGD